MDKHRYLMNSCNVMSAQTRGEVAMRIACPHEAADLTDTMLSSFFSCLLGTLEVATGNGVASVPESQAAVDQDMDGADPVCPLPDTGYNSSATAMRRNKLADNFFPLVIDLRLAKTLCTQTTIQAAKAETLAVSAPGKALHKPLTASSLFKQGVLCKMSRRSSSCFSWLQTLGR